MGTDFLEKGGCRLFPDEIDGGMAVTISTKGRYALRVMIDLALYSDGEYIALKEISVRQEISVKYLEQVVSLLHKAGFLHSLRGNNGGYRLAKKPSEYTAGDILRAAEGTLAPIACLQDETNQCSRCHQCATLPFWQKYYQIVTDYVDSVTLEELAENVRSDETCDYII